MTSIFIVRAEDRGAPESIIYGVYPSAKLALAIALEGLRAPTRRSIRRASDRPPTPRGSGTTLPERVSARGSPW
jgi:hypothetical protein